MDVLIYLFIYETAHVLFVFHFIENIEPCLYQRTFIVTICHYVCSLYLNTIPSLGTPVKW